MGDLFREIDEELRQERFEKLWQAYGRYAIGAAMALVLGVVAWISWDKYQVSQRQAESRQYEAAARLLSEGRKEDAAALFANLADRSGSGYRVLSRFHQAALRADSGDRAGAVTLYDAIAANSGLDRTFRDAATVLAVTLEVDNREADSAALSARLEPLMTDDGPWRHAARELAGLIALKAGDTPKAKSLFKKIADDLGAPQGMRARAAQLLAVLDN